LKSSTSKRAKVTATPVEKKFNIIMRALTNEETVVPGPESCRTMLVAVSTAALKIPKDERHADQDAALTMLTEIFDAEKGRWETRVAEANSAVEKATVERTEKVGLRDAADTEIKSQKDVVGEKVEAQSQAMAVLDECKEEHSTALAHRGDAEAAKEILVKSHEYGLGIQEAIKGLKEGIYENPKELKKHISDVCELFAGLGAEEALVKTLPQVFRRDATERGSFDDMALQQLDLYMSNHLSSLSSKIEAADAVVAGHDVAATAWEAAVEVADEKKRESEEAIKAAQDQQEHLQEALTSARKVLKEHTAALKSRDSDLAKEQFGLQSVEDVLEALEFLREYIAPAPAPEEEVKELSADSAVETQMTIDEVETKQLEVVSLDHLTPSAASKEIECLVDIPMVVA